MERTASQGGLTSCLKKADIYATSISPTYNGLKKYPTTYGGLLSILSFVIILGWLTLQSLNIWAFKVGDISWGSSSLSSGNSMRPLWNINSTQMITTNRIFSLNTTIFKVPDNKSFDQYLTTLYV